MKSLSISITGMHCGSCAKRVERELGEAGASKSSVDFKSGKAEVEFDEKKSSEQKLLKAVESAGYKASVSGGKSELSPAAEKKKEGFLGWFK